MLSKTDAAIAARDPDLPGLALVLDADRLLAALHAALPQVALLAAEPTYLRYKPRTSCIAGFRVTAADRAPISLYAKAYGEAQYRLLRAREEPSRWAQEVPPGRVLLDASCTAIRPLSNDRELKVLQRFERAGDQARLLQRLLHKRLAPPGAAQIEPLRYKPERRFVGRVVHDGQPLAVIRAYAAAEFEAAFAGAAFGAAAGGPPLLGVLARRHVLATGWTKGTTLRVRTGDDTARGELYRVGAVLARLHALDIAAPSSGDHAAAAQAVLRAAGAVQSLCPALGHRAAALAGRLAEALAATPPRRCLVHGDFSPEQVVIDGDAVRLIDWDSAAPGDPAADLGSFLARLDAGVLGPSPPPYDAAAAGEALCEGYAAASGALPRTITLHRVAAMMRLLPEPFRQRRQDWWERTAALLDGAQALHRHCGRTHSIGTPKHPPGLSLLRDAHSTGDPDMPLLKVALDTEAMRPLLAKALAIDPLRLALAVPRLRRHKPGRSALTGYAITEPGNKRTTLLGKMRSKGLDARAHAVQRALWCSGFGPSACDGIMVPEPLGTIPTLNMWLQREVAGVPTTSLFGAGGDIAPAARAAEALAKLHRAGIAAPRRWSSIDETTLLRSRLREAAALRPAIAGTIRAVLAGAERIASRLPDHVPCGIHRDFHPAQVLIDGEQRVHLVDFDLYAEGDPALDAGNFVAHLVELGLRAHDDPRALQDHIDAFVSRFLALSPVVNCAAVDAWAWLSLARHIYLSTRYPDRLHLTGRIALLCEARLADLEGQPCRSLGVSGAASASV